MAQPTSSEDWVAAGVPGCCRSSSRRTTRRKTSTKPCADAGHRAGSRRHRRTRFSIVNDNSNDNSRAVLAGLAKRIPHACASSTIRRRTVRLCRARGARAFRGDAVAIVMADGSDAPADLVKYYRKLSEGYDCVFGSRFIEGSKLIDYPTHKLIINRHGQSVHPHPVPASASTTSPTPSRCYRREVIAGLQPLLSHHFNLTVELPLEGADPRLQFRRHPDQLAEPQGRHIQTQHPRNGQPLSLHRALLLDRETLSRGDYRRRRG